jgi:undecaprenyl-diphosphatase
MKKNGKRLLLVGCILVIAFVVWTVLVQTVDVQPIGQNGTDIGFATWNVWFHNLTGVHMTLYTITDWLGLIPVFVCMIFGGIGLIQVFQRKSIFKVDLDIIFLGIYYVIVVSAYLIFEMIPINYRPILIEGFMEASYPSSTTLLVLSVMPTLNFQVNQRIKNTPVRKIICIMTSIFSVFMVMGRLVSGVHWVTDIAGSIMLSFGIFYIYKAVVLLCKKEEK